MARAWSWGAVTLTACSFASNGGMVDAAHRGDASGDAPHDGRAGDAAHDAAHDAASGPQLCFDVPDLAFVVCLASAPTGSVTLVDEQLHTDGGARCSALGSASMPACAIAGSDVTVPDGITLAALGPNPLVVIATDTLDLAGTIDVASHRSGALAGQVGAMANPSGCGGGTLPAADSSGAGAGGSFSTTGANGGDGTPAASHGSPGATASVALRGGCAGQTGNSTGGNGGGGDGGNGGGVVVLIAPTIHVEASGIVDASGEGGDLAPVGDTRGGGGGGAGGLIALQALTIQVDSGGQLFANGGGGGGGTSSVAGDTAGGDPTSATTAAPGGTPAGDAGAGGAGFFTDGTSTTHAAAAGGSGTNPTDGGGGGGGGAGYIHANGSASVTGGTCSPPLS